MIIAGVCLSSYPHFLPISIVTRTIFYKCKSDYFYILAEIFQWFSLIFRFYNLQVLHSMVFLPLHIHFLWYSLFAMLQLCWPSFCIFNASSYFPQGYWTPATYAWNFFSPNACMTFLFSHVFAYDLPTPLEYKLLKSKEFFPI